MSHRKILRPISEDLSSPLGRSGRLGVSCGTCDPEFLGALSMQLASNIDILGPSVDKIPRDENGTGRDRHQKEETRLDFCQGTLLKVLSPEALPI